MTRRSLNGKVAAITGGARGIGLATAQALTAAGVRVAIGDLDEDLAKAAAKEIGGNAVGLHLDVTDHAGFTAFLDEVERELGPLDVLVNNAGIMLLDLLDDESGREHGASGGDRPDRRHPRHSRGRPPDEAPAQRAHRQHCLRRGQGRHGRRRDLFGRRNMVSSACARPCISNCAEPV